MLHAAFTPAPGYAMMMMLRHDATLMALRHTDSRDAAHDERHEPPPPFTLTRATATTTPFAHRVFTLPPLRCHDAATRMPLSRCRSPFTR